MSATALAPARLGHAWPRLSTPAPDAALTRGGDVIALAEALGEPLLPWQANAANAAARCDADGRWLHRQVGVVVARQNGKTHLLRMRVLTGLFVWREGLIVHAAQNREIALETFRAVEATIRSTPWLAAELDYIRRTNGQEEIALRNGCRYRIVAATPGGARGLSADVVLLDEAREHRTSDAYAALSYTTQARPNAQIWLTSNAGDAGSVVLNKLRDRALEAIAQPGSDPALCYLEWSAGPSRALDDRDGWAEANPSLGHMIDEATIHSGMLSDPPAVFRTEALCQWVDTLDSPWTPGRWEGAEISALALDATGTRPTWLGLDVSLDRREAALVAVQLVDEDEQRRLLDQLDDQAAEIFTAALDGVLPGLAPPRYLAVLLDTWQADAATIDELAVAGDIAARARDLHARSVAFDRYTAAGVAARLDSAGFRTVDGSGAAFAAASDGLLSAMDASPPRIVHTGQAELTDQLMACAKKPASDGGWRIVRRKSTGPVAAAVALAMALHQAQVPVVEPRILVG